VTDSRVKGRVKGLFGGVGPDSEQMDPAPVHSGPEAQHQALQVLVLAQRTADEHVGTAQRQADKIRADARGAAEQIVRDAQAHAEGVRRDAGKALSEARTTAEQIVRDAKSHGELARRDADRALAEARARADDIVKTAQAGADELESDARQRYDETVGSLAAKCAALQQQIEALQQYDREYRARLRAFMQSQLQALGGEDPSPNAEVRRPAEEQDLADEFDEDPDVEQALEHEGTAASHRS